MPGEYRINRKPATAVRVDQQPLRLRTAAVARASVSCRSGSPSQTVAAASTESRSRDCPDCHMQRYVRPAMSYPSNSEALADKRRPMLVID